ncbi:mandelate racemase/muconate lactonizing enzyme family protein [Mesorhizobium sp. M0243]|uniref:mandelate racemase/muconate lactonizing enzyme family protein n=1 Tax=Mesorhizobium sp. M0243 TaxID=2956925 RepID=UPI00333950B4
MKIKMCDVYAYTLSYVHGEYVMSGGRTATMQLSTVIRLVADNEMEGWGEVSTLAGTYLPSFTGGTRAAIQELAEGLIGLDPRNISRIRQIMDGRLLGQQSAKSAIDMACWDLFGKSVNLSIAELLGGVLQESFPLYEAVPLGSPAAMVDFVARRSAAGIRTFQLKVGNDPYEDADRVKEVAAAAKPGTTVIADSNGGWTLQKALIAVREMAGLDVYVEQPCRDQEDCALVKATTTLPMVLDESVVGVADLYHAKYRAGAGSVNLKLSRLGGITPLATMRDLAQSLGLSVTIEDTWGGDITTSATAQLAASSRPELMLSTSFFNTWTNEHIARDPPRSVDGRGIAPTGAGLGIDVDMSRLGPPLFSVR